MEELSPEIVRLVERIIRFTGGLDNIQRVLPGKSKMLSISVYHMEYVSKKKLSQISDAADIIFTPHWITFYFTHFAASDVAMAIRLYEREEAEKTEEEMPEGESLLNKVFSFFQQIFLPLTTSLVAIGILQSLLLVFASFHLPAASFSDNTVFSTISGAVFSFIPLMAAFSTAKLYKTNPYISVTVAVLLMQPSVIAFVNETILDGILKFQVQPERFSNSILPVLFIIPFQAKLDKWIDGKHSDTFLPIIKPFFLLAASLGIGVFFFGPIMIFFGNAMVAAADFLLRHLSWAVSMLMGGTGSSLVLLGAHYSFLPLVQDSLQEKGYEMLIGPGMLAMNAAHAGAALAVLLKTRKKQYRAYCGSAFILSLLGVSQPALFGIEILLKKPFFSVMIAGAAGGLFNGIMRVKAYGLVNPGLLSLSFFQGEAGNLFYASTGMLIAFLLGFFLTWRMELQDPTDYDLEVAATGIRMGERKEVPFS